MGDGAAAGHLGAVVWNRVLHPLLGKAHEENCLFCLFCVCSCGNIDSFEGQPFGHDMIGGGVIIILIVGKLQKAVFGPFDEKYRLKKIQKNNSYLSFDGKSIRGGWECRG